MARTISSFEDRGPRLSAGLCLFLGASALAVAALLAATTGEGSSWRDDPVLVLFGPNDGEPINCRTATPELVTNYDAPATISVYVNGCYHRSCSLAPAALDPERGLVATPIEVDLDAAIPSRGKAGSGSSSGPLAVTVYLYDALTSELVGCAEWVGRVSRPSLEPLDSPGESAWRIRPLPGDTYFILFAASSRDGLGSSPEDPDAFRSARVVAGGNCAEAAADPAHPGLAVAVGQLPQPAFLVLWTYDAKRGWKSSPVTPAP